MSLPDTATVASRHAGGKRADRPARQRSDDGVRGGVQDGSTTAGTTRVLNLTGYASTAGHSPDPVDEQRLLAALQERAVLQEKGYALAGQRVRVMTCGTRPVRRDGLVALGVGEHGGCQCSGMQRCGSRWCPRCWGLVTRDRARDVQAATAWAVEQGHTVALVTLTASHLTDAVREEAAAAGVSEAAAVRMQPLKPLLSAMQGAWRGMISGRPGQALRQGWIGYARAVELTADDLVFAGHRTETGYHVHWHTVLVLDAGVDLDDLAERMFTRWQDMCRRRGLRASKEGFDLQKAANPAAAAAYVVKGEKTRKDLGMELASSVTKSAGHGRVTPEQILRNLGRAVRETRGTARSHPGDLPECTLNDPPTYAPERLSRLRAQWQEIEEAFDGARWLTWSRDLRKLAGLGQEETAEEIANRQVAPRSSRVAVVGGEWVDRPVERGVAPTAPRHAVPTRPAAPPLDPVVWGESCQQAYAFWQVKAQIDAFMRRCPDTDPEQRFDAMTGWLSRMGFAHRVLTWEAWQEETAAALRGER